MPDLPDPERRKHPAVRPAGEHASRHPEHGSTDRYVELRCKSNFSFLTGASHPEELVEQAARLGHDSIAIADIDSLAGIVRMHCAAKEVGVKLIVGAEIRTTDGPPVGLYAMNRHGYGRLARLITTGRMRAAKGECHLQTADICDHAADLLAVLHGLPEDSQPYRDAFGDRLYIGAESHCGRNDRRRLARLHDAARSHKIPLVAVNDVHYHVPAHRFLQDVLVCIREGCKVTEAGSRLFPNGERYLKPAEQMARLFRDYPEAIRRTHQIAARCDFSLDELRYEYPPELCPAGRTPLEHLAELTWTGASRRYDARIPDRVRKLIEHELELIAQLKYEHYFLTVWDLVRFARSQGILCQGRGSAANSAVCFCLGITSVDPARTDVLFERFVSAERNEPPDIDVDFEHERREEVIQYIYDKYGRDRAGIAAEVITYRPRSAVRDVGKALGLSLDRIDALAKRMEWWSDPAQLVNYFRDIGLDPNDYTMRCILGLCRRIVGFPRHLSQHVGGFVMTAGPLCEMVPIENAAMPDRTFIEWDKDDIDSLGILKVDCLALGMLTAIRKTFDLIAGTRTTDSVHPSRARRNPRATPPRDNCPSRAACPSRARKEADTTSTLPLPQRPHNRVARTAPQGQAVMCDGYPNCDNCHSRAACPSRARKEADTTATFPSPQQPRVARTAPQGQAVMCNGYPNCDNCHSRAACPSRARKEADTTATTDTPATLLDNSQTRHTVANRMRTAQEQWHTAYPSPYSRDSFPNRLLHKDANERLALVPPEDSSVYDMICRANTVGVFQIESRAQMSMLPRLRPRCFYDLVIEVAIVRPGPIQGGMIHPYLRRRNGEEEVRYPSEAVRDVLHKTLGVPLFQEQAMRLAIVAAGFTPGEADRLRRSMAAWRRNGRLDHFRDRLIGGMLANGYDQTFAEQLFRQIQGFSEYGFPESHAASFALLVYVSAWLKRYYPAAFAAALLNSQPMGFYAPAQIVRDAREHGVRVLPVDINGSDQDSLLESNIECHMVAPENTVASEHWGKGGPALRLGMRLVKGLPGAQADRIAEARRRGPYRSVTDLLQRSGASRAALARLAAADAFRSIGLDRRQALWSILGLDDELPLFAGVESNEPAATLPGLKLDEEVVGDYDAIGLSLKAHPMSLIREELNRSSIMTARQIRAAKQGRYVSVAGIVLIRQRPSTAMGIIFMTTEDETGTANLVIRPKVYERFRPAARTATAIVATGRIERAGEVVHVQVQRLETLSSLLSNLRAPSRDFH